MTLRESAAPGFHNSRPHRKRSFSVRGYLAVGLLNFSCERRGEVLNVGHMRDRGDYGLTRIVRERYDG